MGKTGEDIIASVLENNLDDSYTYIRNYVIPDSKIGDIDGLLIGPNGITILEIKYYRGEFELLNGEFYKLYKKGKYYLWHNPIKQAYKQKDSLELFLKTKGLDLNIKCNVVLAHGHVRNINGPTGVYVLNKDNLVDFIIKETYSNNNFTDQSKERLIDYLLENKF